MTTGIVSQNVPKYWQYLGLERSDYGQGNIVNNWILEVIDSGFKENTVLECNSDSMCITVSDFWIREKLRVLDDDVIGDNPSSWLALGNSGLAAECRAKNLTVTDFKRTIKNANRKNYPFLSGKAEYTGYWQWCISYRDMSCDTNVLQNRTHITFRNQLSSPYTFPHEVKSQTMISALNPIFETPFIAIPFACHYPKNLRLSTDFIPVAKTQIESTFYGEGTFNITVRLYNDETFTTFLNKSLKKTDRIYGGAHINNENIAGTELYINIQNMWSTKGADIEDADGVPIIVNGCIADKEVTDFKYHTNVDAKHSNHEKYFSMRGAKFLASEDGEQIYATSYIHAIATVCLNSEQDCLEECEYSSKIQGRSLTPNAFPKVKVHDNHYDVYASDKKSSKPVALFGDLVVNLKSNAESPTGFLQNFLTNDERLRILKNFHGKEHRSKRSL